MPTKQLSLLKKEKDAIAELKKELSKKYKLLWMKLIGSKARGDFDEESDIDIVIVIENVDWNIEKDIYEKCFYLGLKYDILISPIVYSEKDINDSLTRMTPFYRTVEAEGIMI
jgi:predicted nucleotidyltransferase